MVLPIYTPMNQRRLIPFMLCIFLSAEALAQTGDMDSQLAGLTENLAGQVTSHAKKKVAVLDFTDLQGASSELGRYIAEQLTVNLVMTNRAFSVLDRANLKSILDEHKLTAKGLVDPENAKKLGMFAGVDALILGNIVPLDQNIQVTAKVITTDTAEIVGGARAKFRSDQTVQQLLSRPTTEATTSDVTPSDDSSSEGPKLTKSFGDLRVEVQSLRAVESGQYLLTMALKNQNPKKSLWVALHSDYYPHVNGTITDANGLEFGVDIASLSGIPTSQYGPYRYAGTDPLSPASEIKPGDSISATVKFKSRDGRRASAGNCTLQLEVLVGQDFGGGDGTASVNNLMGTVKAD
jgi:TolB-like protein